MTRWLQVAALGLAASLLTPWVVSAQSLGDVAAQEKERRKGKPAKSYSEDDLRRAGGPGSSFETTSSDDSGTATEGTAPAEGATAEGGSGEGAPKAEPGAPKEKTEDELRAEQEKDWRERMKKAQEDVTRFTGEVNDLDTRLNDLTGNYYSASRTSMLNRRDEAKNKLSAAQDALGKLQEEGRQKRFR